MSERVHALQDLVECRLPLTETMARVVAFPFPSDEELVTIRAANVQAVLQRFIEGGLTAPEVLAWADALEMREDVGYSADVADALFVLSTPEINGALAPRLAREMIARYGQPTNWTMSTLIHQRVAECRAGTNPQAICRVSSGWVVLGDVQFLRGYSLILPDPVVPHLNALSGEDRKTLLYEASVLGDALLELTAAIRINYEILGNLEPALHVHVFPRYEDEPADLRTRPVWFYDWEQAPKFDAERDAPLMKDIRAYLENSGHVTPGVTG